MDTLTHIVLGATVGEIIAGKKIGKRAMIIGAVAQSLPDIDFVAALWMSPAQYFFAHRGLTHSIVFILSAAVFLSWVINNFNSFKISFRHWFIFFFAQLLIHISIDSLNAYGVGWLEPFSHKRVSFDLLFVADPFLSTSLAIACVALILLPTKSSARMKWAVLSTLMSVGYIFYAATNKLEAVKAVDQSFLENKIYPTKTLITPTPLNSWLWYVVAEVQGGYFIGYHSVFDRSRSFFQFFAKNDSLLNHLNNRPDTQSLILLARDFYIVEQRTDTLVFSNLRFGQVNGWTNPSARFIFRYNLNKPGNSFFTVQQGRFSGWNQQTWSDFLKRIEGN
ncbi:MAG TPA: metal-dependent hydrolase [Cytophagales bacterium]|jgi:inner membrane protein|nr:metal-dependent hydrolase [Cytophagales bacterium]